MNPIIKFFHELFHPHCTHCTEMRKLELEQIEIEHESAKYCNSCENLKMQLSYVNQQNQILLNKLITKDEPIQPIQTEQQKIIQTRNKPWSVIRQELEHASRLRAEELKQNINATSKSAKPDTHPAQTALINGNMKAEIQPMINKLETEIGISDAKNSETTEVVNN